jgi:hypothetical protein
MAVRDISAILRAASQLCTRGIDKRLELRMYMADKP